MFFQMFFIQVRKQNHLKCKVHKQLIPPRINDDSNNYSTNIQILTELEQVILNLNNENLQFSVEQTMNLFDANFPYLSNFACLLSIFITKGRIWHIFQLLKINSNKGRKNIDNPKIIDIFCRFLSESETQESYYLLEKIINLNLVDFSITK